MAVSVVREKKKRKSKGGMYIETRRVAIENAREVQLLHLFFKAAREAGVHARATGQDNVLVQLGADVDRRRLDRLEEHLCDARLLDVDQVRLEHTLGSFEAL